MPAKRKASASQTLDEPGPTRRRTRSNTVNLSSPSRESQLQHPNVSQAPTTSVPNPSTRSVPSPSPIKKERLLTRSQTKARFGLVVYSGTPHADLPGGQEEEDAKSEDELLLSPTKKSKKKTRETVLSKSSPLPRVYVEIVSPIPHPSKRALAKTTTDPSSPTPTRSKVVQKVPPSPSPTSLRKSSANNLVPSKPLRLHGPRGTRSSSIQNSSGYGGYERSSWCLYAQKRSIFQALHDQKTAVFDQEDGNGPPSANAVALEQLKALLTGTLDRGEGNSCLLIGPRGSGKSRVSVYAPGIDTA